MCRALCGSQTLSQNVWRHGCATIPEPDANVAIFGVGGKICAHVCRMRGLVFDFWLFS